MKKIYIIAGAIALLSFSGCLLAALFTATRYFYIDNQSGYTLKIQWETVSEEVEGGTTNVASNEKIQFASGQILESDDLKPSQYFDRIAISIVATGGFTSAAYLQDPIDDTLWVRENLDERNNANYTLVITNDDLTTANRY